MVALCLALSVPLPIVSFPVHILCPTNLFPGVSSPLPLCNGPFLLAYFLQIPKVKPTNLKRHVSVYLGYLTLYNLLQFPPFTANSRSYNKDQTKKIQPWCNCGIIIKEVTTTGFPPGLKAYYTGGNSYLVLQALTKSE